MGGRPPPGRDCRRLPSGVKRLPGAARRLPVAACALLVAAAASAACGDSSRMVDAERAALEAEEQALEAYLAVDPSASMLPAGDAMVVVRAELLRKLLRSALPLEAVVAGRYRLRLDSAEVQLSPGLARVHLTGRASPAGTPRLFAEVGLLGAFEIVRAGGGAGSDLGNGGRADSGLGGRAGSDLGDGRRAGSDLAARVRILGLQTREVGLGPLSPPAERLLDQLARVRTREYNEILDRVEIPVRLAEVLSIPALEVEEATIPAAELPVRFELDAVRVLEEGIFVALRVEREWRDVARWSTGGPGDGPGGSP